MQPNSGQKPSRCHIKLSAVHQYYVVDSTVFCVRTWGAALGQREMATRTFLFNSFFLPISKSTKLKSDAEMHINSDTRTNVWRASIAIGTRRVPVNNKRMSLITIITVIMIINNETLSRDRQSWPAMGHPLALTVGVSYIFSCATLRTQIDRYRDIVSPCFASSHTHNFANYGKMNKNLRLWRWRHRPSDGHQ